MMNEVGMTKNDHDVVAKKAEEAKAALEQERSNTKGIQDELRKS